MHFEAYLRAELHKYTPVPKLVLKGLTPQIEQSAMAKYVQSSGRFEGTFNDSICTGKAGRQWVCLNQADPCLHGFKGTPVKTKRKPSNQRSPQLQTKPWFSVSNPLFRNHPPWMHKVQAETAMPRVKYELPAVVRCHQWR